MIFNESATATKYIILATLNASNASADGLEEVLKIESNHEYNFEVKNSNNWDDNRSNSATTFYWQTEEHDLIRIFSREFLISKNQELVFNVSKEILEESKEIPLDLSMAIDSVIRKIGKSQTDLPNRL